MDLIFIIYPLKDLLVRRGFFATQASQDWLGTLGKRTVPQGRVGGPSHDIRTLMHKGIQATSPAQPGRSAHALRINRSATALDCAFSCRIPLPPSPPSSHRLGKECNIPFDRSGKARFLPYHSI